jgi:hypothetical protein
MNDQLAAQVPIAARSRIATVNRNLVWVDAGFRRDGGTIAKAAIRQT